MTTQTQIILEDWPIAVPGSLVVWRKRLAEARKRRRFTKQDREAMSHLNTCAVGEYLGFPSTASVAAFGYNLCLDRLGWKAIDAVIGNHFDAFEAILTELEALPRP